MTPFKSEISLVYLTEVNVVNTSTTKTLSYAFTKAYEYALIVCINGRDSTSIGGFLLSSNVERIKDSSLSNSSASSSIYVSVAQIKNITTGIVITATTTSISTLAKMEIFVSE